MRLAIHPPASTSSTTGNLHTYTPVMRDDRQIPTSFVKDAKLY